jgi:hypothetical protein
MAGESLANVFAHRLLVPTRWFAEDAPATGYDLPVLKKRFRTASHEVIAWRFLDLPAPCIVTVVDNGSVSRRRSSAGPVESKLLADAESLGQRRAHETGRTQQVRVGGWTVQAWPVRQQDWKREILRSVVDSD